MVASEYGNLNVRLTIDTTTVSFASGMLFNGSFPGSTLVVHPGDTLTVTLHNHLGPKAEPGANGPLLPNMIRG